jgi:hypothetical protein
VLSIANIIVASMTNGYGTLVEGYRWRKPKYSKKTYISATSHTKNPRGTDLRLNLGLNDKADDSLIHATVLTKC